MRKTSVEDIFKPTIESLHKISNDTGIKVVNLPYPKILLSKLQCLHLKTFINLLLHVLMERLIIKLTTY
jgi:hypothetical protein